ncbi:hypothetical protein GE21DRAFT_1289278 [Neurospora crassa]|nr:hypothetical protein GE21DRAFT_1289278 [Neurospora crassa]
MSTTRSPCRWPGPFGRLFAGHGKGIGQQWGPNTDDPADGSFWNVYSQQSIAYDCQSWVGFGDSAKLVAGRMR